MRDLLLFFRISKLYFDCAVSMNVTQWGQCLQNTFVFIERTKLMPNCGSYTHRYDVKDWKSPKWRKIWPQFIEDAQLIMEASDVLLVGPLPHRASEAITAPIATVEKGIIFNGLGDAGHEPFYFCEDADNSVATNQKPYDLTISCILLRAYSLCPKNIKIQ